MIPGETVASGAPHPGTDLMVLKSNAGYYLGYLDADGLPYSRETDYFESRPSAELALDEINKTKAAGSDPRRLAFVR